MTTTLDFQQELVKTQTAAYVVLYEIDLSAIGGAIFRFAETSNNGASITFKGETWTPFPITINGISVKQGEAPDKPTLIISNIDKLMQASIATLGDVVGGKVTRYRTFERFLPTGATPNDNAHNPPDEYIIDQKTSHNKTAITWNLTSKMDIEDDKIPKRQVLQQDVGDLKGFPGVAVSSRVRF